MVAESLFVTMRYMTLLQNGLCYDVAVEPPLQQLTGMANVLATANWQDEAYSDIHARRYRGDIKVPFLMVGFSPKYT